ncbi:MAG: sigma-70 family RNA polymerase sigma factor [Bacteroidales bacterium]|nr:sigma-70 family RNA polymerase sigma factor [Bacteroidales bacterium]
MDNKKFLWSIYEEQAEMLYSYGCKFTMDKEMIKDCIHDVFVKLYEKDLSSVQNLKFYLLRSFKNRLLDELSDKSKDYIEDASFSYALQVSSDEDVLIENDQVRELKLFIEKAFENLTNRQKEAIYLYYIEGLNYSDIGELLQMNYQSVRNTVHRALIRLRERLGDSPPVFLFFLIYKFIFTFFPED